MGGLPMMCFAALAHDVDAIRQMANYERLHHHSIGDNGIFTLK
jgi:hypothetical protein